MVLVGCALLGWAGEHFAHERADGLLRACAGKMKGRSILLELHTHLSGTGAYPATLEDLYGKESLAECPARGEFRYESDGTAYTLLCTGHRDATRPGWPR